MQHEKPAEAPLTVTLQARQWDQILNLLAEGPYRVAAPLIAEIMQQANQSSPTARLNGKANEAGANA